MGRTTAAVLAAAFMLSGAGCNDAGDGGGALEEALSFAPASYSSFGFTDWEAMRTYAGIEDTDPEDADAQTLADFNQPNTPLAFSYGALQYPDHRSNWGWNELDLDWGAEVIPTEGPPFHVLGFNDDYELTDAEEDLDLRTSVLEEENSLVSAQPYSELLAVTESEVDAADGRLQLFSMFLQQDLSFALC